MGLFGGGEQGNIFRRLFQRPKKEQFSEGPVTSQKVSSSRTVLFNEHVFENQSLQEQFIGVMDLCKEYIFSLDQIDIPDTSRIQRELQQALPLYLENFKRQNLSTMHHESHRLYALFLAYEHSIDVFIGKQIKEQNSEKKQSPKQMRIQEIFRELQIINQQLLQLQEKHDEKSAIRVGKRYPLFRRSVREGIQKQRNEEMYTLETKRLLLVSELQPLITSSSTFVEEKQTLDNDRLLENAFVVRAFLQSAIETCKTTYFENITNMKWSLDALVQMQEQVAKELEKVQSALLIGVENSRTIPNNGEQKVFFNLLLQEQQVYDDEIAKRNKTRYGLSTSPFKNLEGVEESERVM